MCVCVFFFIKSTCFSPHILTTRELFRQSFEKFSSIKFHKKSPLGAEFVPFWQTDG